MFLSFLKYNLCAWRKQINRGKKVHIRVLADLVRILADWDLSYPPQPSFNGDWQARWPPPSTGEQETIFLCSAIHLQTMCILAYVYEYACACFYLFTLIWFQTCRKNCKNGSKDSIDFFQILLLLTFCIIYSLSVYIYKIIYGPFLRANRTLLQL